MPRRTDLQSVLVIGSGPIVIGQACEFDYSGTQACRVLRAEGLRVSLVNSNPATIMTDPEFADATYVEPITPEMRREGHRPGAARRAAADPRRPDRAQHRGRAARGRRAREVRRRADRRRHRRDPARRGPPAVQGDRAPTSAPSPPAAVVCHTHGRLPRGGRAARLPGRRPAVASRWAAPAPASPTTRPSCAASPAPASPPSPSTEVLLEESILGWKEYELELMRDHADNVVVVCSIENVDPMGVHTGDSITVAPAMTLTDREYQHMRDVGIAVIRAVGVDTGGCNIQFAVDPQTGRLIVIEMNPRVSRSSALASKATGFPIAKIAAKLAVGYTLDEIPNDITARDAGQLRADARLRRGQGAAVRVREVPRRRPDADHAHEERRRGDGDRPQLHRGAAEGAALDGDEGGRLLDRARPRRRHRSSRRSRSRARSARRPAATTVEQALRPARRVERGARGERDRPVVPRPDPAPRRAARRAVAAGRRALDAAHCCARQAARLLRPAARRDLSAARRGRRPARCGTRSASGRSTRPSTPARPSSPPGRRTTTRPTTRRPRSSRRPSGRRCSSSAAGRTGSGRASSSTTPACTRRWRCATPATRP